MRATIVRRMVPTVNGSWPFPIPCPHCGGELALHEYVDVNSKTGHVECCEWCEEPHAGPHSEAMACKKYARGSLTSARSIRECGGPGWRTLVASALKSAAYWRLQYVECRDTAVKAG